MPAETVSEEEAGDLRGFSEDGVMVRRHFIEAGPGSLGIDRDIFEYGHAIRRAGQYLLDEAHVEICFVAGRFIRIVPRQQKSAALGAKVKAVGHVDDHGRGVGKLVKWFGRNQHAAQGFDRQLDAHHLGNRSRPRPATVHNRARGDSVARGRDFEAPVVKVARDSSYARVLPEPGAVVAGPRHKADHGAVGIDKTIGGTKAAAKDVIGAELRELAADFVTGDEAHILQPHGNLLVVVGAQVGHVFFVGRAKKISLGPVVAWIAEPLLEARIKGDRVKRHLDVDGRRELRPHTAHALARGSLALRGLALKNEDVLATGGDKMVGDAGADNPSADENDVRSVHGCRQSCGAIVNARAVTGVLCGDGAKPALSRAEGNPSWQGKAPPPHKRLLRHRHLRRGRQQLSRVSVLRSGSNLFRRSDLDDLALIHHRDAGREIANDGHGVRDEQIGQAEIALQLLQKIHDLRANAGVESGNRFIGHDELRLQGKRAGDADALALASGKFVWITRHGRFIHSHGTQKFPHSPAADIAAKAFVPGILLGNFLMQRRLMQRRLMQNERLGDHVLNAEARVERTERVLKDDLHVAAKAAQFRAVRSHQIDTLEKYGARSRLDQAQD